MKKMKTGIGVMLALLCCILMCTGVVYATGDDTDGTELQVAQPVILEVQLGPQWVGVEFQLKTDVGLYPGTIAVGQDGILRQLRPFLPDSKCRRAGAGRYPKS